MWNRFPAIQRDRGVNAPLYRLTGSADKIRIRVRFTKESVTTSSSKAKNGNDSQHDDIEDDDHERHDETTPRTNDTKHKNDHSDKNSALFTPALRKSSRLRSTPIQNKEVYVFAPKTSRIPYLKREVRSERQIWFGSQCLIQYSIGARLRKN